MQKQNLDRQLLEKIIAKAEGYTRMSNALTVDAAFGKAATDFLGDKNPAWGEYKQAAKGKFLNRKKEIQEIKKEEMLRGAQEAAWARRDAEVLEAEASADKLSEEREGKLNFNR